MPELKEQQEAEEKLEALTEERIEEAFGEESVDSTPEDKTPEEEPEVIEDDQKEEEPEVEEDSTPEDKTPEEEPKAEEETTPESDETQEISEAYIKAAKHQGWTEEEVQELYDKNPELAMKTLEKFQESTIRLAKEFSTLGQTKRDLEAQKVVTPEPEKKVERKGIDFAAVEKEYGAEDPIVAMLKQQEEQNRLLTEKLDAIDLTPQPEPAENMEAIGQQIDGFFSSTDMDNYTEFYGATEKGAKNWDSLTGTQTKNRWAVTQMADDIIAGAKVQGRAMGFDEAMDMAHMSISGPERSKAIREEIKQKVVKRGKSITLRSNSSKAPASKGPKSATEFESATQQRLDAIYK